MTAPFRFRLARVLGLRRVQEAAALQAHEAARQAASARERKLEGLEAEAVRTREVKRRLAEASVDLPHLRMTQEFLHALERRIAAEREALGRLRAEAERRRGERVEASRRVKALERLEDRRRAEWRAAEDIEERKRLDEIPGRREASA